MDHGAGHKDTAFTWEMGDLILARIAEGETVKQITADPRMPAYCTVFRWMRMVPQFGDEVAALRAAIARGRLAERDAYRRLRRLEARRRRPWISGRRPQVSAAALAQPLAEIRAGASVTEAVAQPGAPSFKALYSRVRGCPGFRAAFVDACDSRADWVEYDVEAVVGRVAAIGIPAANAQIRAIEAREGRLRPKLYRAPRRG